MSIIQRDLYISQILPFIDRPFVKVIAGIRRCGKSVVLKMIEKELESRGMPEERIVYMNFESFEWMDISDAQALYQYIKEQRQLTEGKLYILLNENDYAILYLK